MAKYDIYISSGSNLNCLSSSYFPRLYEDTTGKRDLTFAGNASFYISDVEVLQVKKL